MSDSTAPAIGIDLGTTYPAIAYVDAARTIHVESSTQHPAETQEIVARVLALLLQRTPLPVTDDSGSAAEASMRTSKRSPGATRSAPGSRPTQCDICGGRGEVQSVQRSFLGQVVTSRPCPNCRGFGTIIPEPCRECSGDGRVRSRRSPPPSPGRSTPMRWEPTAFPKPSRR